MKKEDIKRIIGAAKAGGAAGGILTAAVFGMVAHGKKRKAERLAREAAEKAELDAGIAPLPAGRQAE